MEQSGKFLGHATTAGRVLNLGRFPGMVAARTPEDRVQGEVFELENPEAALAVLDRYEGSDFARRLAEVAMDNGETTTAWIYWYCGKNQGS